VSNAFAVPGCPLPYIIVTSLCQNHVTLYEETDRSLNYGCTVEEFQQIKLG